MNKNDIITTQVDESKANVIITNKGNVQSFGGQSLVENLDRANKAIAKLEYTERIWDRSRSQWALKHLVHSFSSDWKNLRQISAELQRKRDAIREAKFGYAKKLQEVEIKKAKILILQNKPALTHAEVAFRDSKIGLLEIEIAEILSNAEAGVVKIEGALKEILTLEEMHDQLVIRMGDITEEEYEKQEAISHMKHAVDQAIRDVRAQGRIGQGVQEYLQQCGINVSAVFKDIVDMLKQENETQDLTTNIQYTFLEAIAIKYSNCAVHQAMILGFSPDAQQTISYNPTRDDR